MAQGKIIVETAQLDAASAKVGELAGTYKGEYEKLYKLVEELQASWAGADNTAYTTQIEGFRDDFEKMYTLMTDYSDFLKTTAKRYRDTQDERKTAAAKLRTNAGTCNRLGKAVMRCSKISTFTKSTYNIQGYETGECYVETGRKSESN